MRHMKQPLTTAIAGLVTVASASTVWAADNDNAALEEIRVIGTAITRGELNLNALPFAAQRFTQKDLSDAAFFSAVDLLEDRATSVSTNAAQNNRLQPDVQYRGFTASPLLGLSQGLAVYHNGVRVNEAFGDTVNWDLLPASSMETLDLVGGSNPVYGLNTIGGALVVNTRTGFSSEGGNASVTLGDYSTRDYTLSYGANNEEWGFFIAADAMDEDGWRDFSASEAQTLYSALSWRGAASELDIFFNYGDSNLKGNGAVPLDLLNASRSAVFTHPDQTENELMMTSVSFRHAFSDDSQISINAFYRDLETQTFNGDGSEYEECGEDDDDDDDGGGDEMGGEEHPFEGFLCNDDDEPVTDKLGAMVDEDFNAINNRSTREQESYGFTLQYLGRVDTGSVGHEYVAGVDWFKGQTDFASNVEFSELTDTRGTVLTGRFDSDGDTNLDTQVETWSAFVSDSVALNDSTTLTLSARYNSTRTQGDDPTGQRPELAGDHRFNNFNAGAGVVWQMNDMLSVYGGVQSSARTPTPVELACSHPDAPCTLPNSFLADPPLDDVRAISTEFGVRGSLGIIDQFRLGGFVITADDDILFQTTGGVSSNEGFFQNAADTRRAGLELELAGGTEVWNWYMNYTYMRATFEDDFFSSSPNNPQSENDRLFVGAGSDMPGLPDNNLKLGAATRITDALQIGADVRYMSGVYLRGDEANVDDKTDDWTVVDLYARMTLGNNLYLETRVDNVLDEEYETFGLYGEADEVLTNIQDTSGRFLGPAMPRMWWVTVGVRF